MNDNEIKLSSNRSFGIVFFIVFLIIATWPLLNGNEIRYWSLVGKADIPTIESFEESIADKAEEKLIGCVADFTAFSKTGLKVSATDPQIKVDIGLQIIVFNVDYTVKSNNGDSTSELDTFSQKVASDLGKQINMAEKFVKANNERPKTFCLSCTAELAEEFKTPFAFEQYGTDYLITLGDTLSFSVGYSEEKQVIQALELFHDSPIFHETTPELEALFEKIIVEGKR